MAPFEQVAVPSQDSSWTYKQQEPAELAHRQVLEQTGDDSAIGVGESGLAEGRPAPGARQIMMPSSPAQANIEGTRPDDRKQR